MIVDGLDEIFDPRRRRLMVDQIIGLTGRYPKLRLLITSRIAGFDDNPFRAAEFAIATLIDLTPDQIQEFAKAWFTIVFPADPDAAARAGNDLLETLQRRPQLQTIAGNPMILTIMATVARHKRLGRSRAAIYDQALELLCYNWDYKRGLGLPSDSPLIDLQPDDTALMLRRIAWHMQEAPEGLRANAIEEATLHGILDDFFQQDWHFNIPKARRAASEMLYRLQVRNWVLTLRGPALYGFVHRTFLEYLCALELSERFRAQQLDTDTLVTNHVTPRLDDDTWHEVLRLLVGLLPPAAAERILVAILPSNTVDPTEWPRLALAWQGLSEVEPRSLPNLMQTGARLIDVLHDGLARGERVYWESLDAISEAAQAIGPVTWTAIHPPSGEWPSISFETRFQGFRYHQTTTLGLFAAWFTGDPETEPLLRFRVIEDQDKNCRSDALTSLARHFREDPETKGLL